jgi:hypothetical protein
MNSCDDDEQKNKKEVKNINFVSISLQLSTSAVSSKKSSEELSEKSSTAKSLIIIVVVIIFDQFDFEIFEDSDCVFVCFFDSLGTCSSLEKNEKD